MRVRGKTRRCFSVILAFSKSLHESCRLLRALQTFSFLKAVYLGLTLAHIIGKARQNKSVNQTLGFCIIRVAMTSSLASNHG